MNSLIERAIILATEAHAGQLDKAGAPYILHPLRVMLSVQGDASRVAAVLHDVVEDTDVTLDDLGASGFPAEVIAAVEALTKRPDEEGPDRYFAFVERAARNRIARPVKLADIEDNRALSRIAAPTDADRDRIIRYGRARKLLHLIARESGDVELHAPTIMPLKNVIAPDEVEASCPGDRPIFVCDFYLEGAERGREEAGGVRLGRILNVDHHAALTRMEAPITSTQLAYDHLQDRQQRGDNVEAPASWVVINHTDCDSVLSSAMLMGYVDADQELVRASIHADHTGELHPVADLLQSLDETRTGDRTEEQYLESLRNLRLLLAGKDLEPIAECALRRRRERQAEARRLAASGRFSVERSVAFARTDQEIDGAFFPALLPDAAVIMLATPHAHLAGHWTVKIRLGRAAPPGLTLHRLGIAGWDSAFGGRWNAGSNKRGGGTPLDPSAYAELLRDGLSLVAP